MGLKLIIFISIIAFFIGFNYSPVQEKLIVQNITNDRYIVNGTECIKYNTIDKEKITVIPTFKNITLKISDQQKHDIINLKPKSCNSPACSDAFFKCKYDVFDILGYKRPKFSEKQSSGAFNFNRNFENIETLPVLEDGFGKYVEFDPFYWSFYNSGEVEFNKSLWLENETISNNLTMLLNEINRSDILIKKRDNEIKIKLRKI